MAETLPSSKPGQESGQLRTEPSQSRPIESLRRDIDRLFDAFSGSFWPPYFPRLASKSPFGSESLFGAVPVVDIVEKDAAFEILAEFPGFEEKNIEVKLRNGSLVIKGNRNEEKDEQKADYHLQERRSGRFERSFAIPDGVDADKIEAVFDKGVLTIRLPKKAEAQKPEKQIEIKGA